MQNSNPYQLPEDASRESVADGKRLSGWRAVMGGFLLGVAVPVALGIYGICRHNIYASSLGPNEAACGMGMLGAMALVFVVGPIGGTIGAGLGWTASRIRM